MCNRDNKRKRKREEERGKGGRGRKKRGKKKKKGTREDLPSLKEEGLPQGGGHNV